MLAILRRICLALLVLTPALAPAQQPTAGPRMDATATAFRAPRTTESSAPLQRARRGDNSVALMIVGGAAIVLGGLVGNEIGTLIVVFGIVLLLYGLYKYLQ